MALRGLALSLTMLSALLAAPPAIAQGPQAVVHDFCQADALGARVSVPGWATIAPLVAWKLEPAWDHLILITGYSIGPPRPISKGVLSVDVSYSIVARLSAFGLDALVHMESVTYRVASDDDGRWRIAGPPPPPHIFGNRVDVAVVRRSLAHGGFNFVSNTLFVWRMLQSAGWNVSYERMADLVNGPVSETASKPTLGDLVIYLRQGVPYHVGIWQAENQVISSTLNAGIVRTPTDAFGGQVEYLRPPRPAALPDRQPAALLSTATAARNAEPSPASRPSLRHRKATHPRIWHRSAQHVKGQDHRVTKPSATRRVQEHRAIERKARATPVAAAR